MCLFVTAVLPTSADLQKATDVAKSFQRKFAPLHSPLRTQLKPDESYYFTTIGHCDCDTGFACEGAVPSVVTDPAVETEKKVSSFRRQGWSQTKIDRWLAQREQQDKHGDTKLADCERWRDFIAALTQSRCAPYLGLLIHMYEGSLESEDFPIFSRTRLRLHDLNPEIISKLHRDTLYVFST